MNNQVHTQIVSFIWSIADDCLRDVYVRGKYRDVILPMTVIRRLDAMLEGTIENVRNTKKLLDEAKVDNQWPALCNAAGQPFCNASPFLLKDLTSRASKQKLKTDFETYLDGFSPNVQEILEKFKFRNQIATMVDADILGSVIEKFVSSDINLSPNPVYKDDEKTILKHPGLDNHGMGTIFEELIRKFNEENNEEAGEHWTPRDVVELMADLIFIPIADQIKDATYTCYDGACGTGGMLTVAQDRLQTLATRRGKNVSIHLFGQEVQPETYAICKADMLLKGDGEQVEHIVYGSTLSADGNATRQFDFMLANPPYGKSWKVDAEKMGGKKEILDTRFNTYLEDGTEMKMIPRTSDGQLLFLLNNVAKMKKDSPLGSRIAEVHNGSSIFTGDAGSGESNARRYMIENDLVEAIIALPENMFYKEFKKDPYRFLVVADMFQTGFDEPLLHTMYVDKQLYDIQAVQTLSRLNRCHPKKHDTCVLDFANKPEIIQESFSRYYRTTILSGETDPNKLYDLISAMEKHQVYSRDDIENEVNLYLTVLYGSASELRVTLDYDFAEEKKFSYKNLSMEEIIHHLAFFVSRLWQIHVFGEGNTRTTAVFFIKYLRTLGFDATNDIFAENAWYFRNALVRANYNDLKNGVHETTEYLELFLRNLLLDEKNELHNRTMHISGRFAEVDIERVKVDIKSGEVDIESTKVDIRNKLLSFSDTISEKTINHTVEIFSKCGKENCFGRTIVEEITGLKPSRASKLIKLLVDSEVIVPVTGHGKGKYRFQ